MKPTGHTQPQNNLGIIKLVSKKNAPIITPPRKIGGIEWRIARIGDWINAKGQRLWAPVLPQRAKIAQEKAAKKTA